MSEVKDTHEEAIDQLALPEGAEAALKFIMYVEEKGGIPSYNCRSISSPVEYIKGSPKVVPFVQTIF